MPGLNSPSFYEHDNLQQLGPELTYVSGSINLTSRYLNANKIWIQRLSNYSLEFECNKRVQSMFNMLLMIFNIKYLEISESI